MNNLERMRRRKGLTRGILAEKTGIPYQTIANWEKGYRMTSKAKFENLVKIANVLECEVVDLVEDSK